MATIDELKKIRLQKLEAIKKAGFRVAVDCVNSVGGLVIPQLLKALGVDVVYELYCEPNGLFPHNPEPLPENLQEISKLVKEKKLKKIAPRIYTANLLDSESSIIRRNLFFILGKLYPGAVLSIYIFRQERGKRKAGRI
jgi:hypothetical protein